jgi:Cupin domain
MATTAHTAERKSLNQPEETRPFPKGRIEVVNIGGVTMGRATFEPSWKWSDCVKPIAKTDSCQASHLGYVISGEMKIVMDDGQELNFGPGDAMSVPPGHDAWIVGKEPCVVIDIGGAGNYAKPT